MHIVFVEMTGVTVSIQKLVNPNATRTATGNLNETVGET